MTATELQTAISDGICCAGDLSYKANLEEKRGAIEKAALYRSNADRVNALVRSLQLYNFDYEVNCITLAEVSILAEEIKKMCGCGCAQIITDLP